MFKSTHPRPLPPQLFPKLVQPHVRNFVRQLAESPTDQHDQRWRQHHHFIFRTVAGTDTGQEPVPLGADLGFGLVESRPLRVSRTHNFGMIATARSKRSGTTVTSEALGLNE